MKGPVDLALDGWSHPRPFYFVCFCTASPRQLHNIAAYLAYAEHPASSPRAANTESFPVCATTRMASVRRVRHPHPCEEDAHAPMGSKSPAFKGRGSPLTRDLCNIRVSFPDEAGRSINIGDIADIPANNIPPPIRRPLRIPIYYRPLPPRLLRRTPRRSRRCVDQMYSGGLSSLRSLQLGAGTERASSSGIQRLRRSRCWAR